MHPIFRNLSVKILNHVEDHLANNQVSTDEELWDIFIEEFELKAEQADVAVALRAHYLIQTFPRGQGPLFQNDAAWFDQRETAFNSDTAVANCQ